MYELCADLGGTLSPLIVMLAMMMMTGGGSSAASYAFSGKTDDVPFLISKARAAARRIPCPHRRTGGGILIGAPINYAEFFSLSARPADITPAIWDDMSETAFDSILGLIHDAKLMKITKGCGRDGGKLLLKLRALGGSKRQQIQTLDGKLTDQHLVQLSLCVPFLHVGR